MAEAEVAAPAASRLRPLLWSGALLGIEYLVISIAFDARQVAARAPFLAGAGYAVPLVVAIVTAAVLRICPAVRGSLATGPIRVLPLMLHLSLFGAFFDVTRRLAMPGPLPWNERAWVALWLAAGACSSLTLVLATTGPRRLAGALRRLWPALTVAVAVGVAAWTAGRAAEASWPPLSVATLSAVAAVLRMFGCPVVARPEELVVGAGGFDVRVAPSCSGSEGIGLILVLVTAVLVARRRELRFPYALLLLPIGAAAAWCANVIRIATLVVIGSRWSVEFAYGTFHPKAGWILFCAVAVALGALARRPPFTAPATARGA